EHDADAATRTAVGGVQAEETYATGGRAAQTEHEADSGRLAGAIRAKQCHSLTWLDAEVDAPERLDSAVALAGCDQFHYRGHCRCLRNLVPRVAHAVSLFGQTEGVGLQGEDLVFLVREVHHAINNERGHLEVLIPRPCPERPCDNQALHICRVDLLQR